MTFPSIGEEIGLSHDHVRVIADFGRWREP
jgi:hypothetical protein